MKNRCLLLAMLFFASVQAGTIERGTVEEKIKAVDDLKISIITIKAQADTTAKELKAQRDVLQQKIQAMRQDFKRNSLTLKSSTKNALNDLQVALKKFQDSSVLPDEKRDFDYVAAQATADQTSLEQTMATFDNVELPKEF